MAGGFNASMNISDSAGAEETGLPAYPGAVIQNSGKGEKESANLNFSLGDYGLKVVAVKLRSEDAKDKIAAFYLKELARFGTVLDCSQGDPAERKRDRKSKELSCEGERAKRNGVLLKAGTKANQRVVSIEPKGESIAIALVHVEIRGLD